MNKPTASAADRFIATSHAACLAAGALMGHLVTALSAREPSSAAALLAALVMSLCGGASVALLLGHLHMARWRGARPLPTQWWLLSLSVGALAAMAVHALP